MFPFSADDFTSVPARHGFNLDVRHGMHLGLLSLNIEDSQDFDYIAHGISPFWDSWKGSISKAVVDSSSGSLSIKLLPNNEFSQDHLRLISETIRGSLSFNPEVVLGRMLSSLLPILPACVSATDGRSYPMKVVLSVIWYNLLGRWHFFFTWLLCGKLREAFKAKLSIPHNGIYNFTDSLIDEDTQGLLSMGPKHIPSLPCGMEGSKSRIYLFSARFALWVRINFERNPTDAKIGQSVSLSEAVSLLQYLDSSAKPDYSTFYKGLLHEMLVADSEWVGRSCGSGSPCNSFAAPSGTVFIPADKGMGVALVYVHTLLEAEVKILESMHAVISPFEDACSILQFVNTKEAEFRASLSPPQIDFMKPYKPFPINQQEVPFLKLSAKVQKLTPEQIRNKDAHLLSFRPICDSTTYTLNPASLALFKLLCSFKHGLFNRFPSLKLILPLSGQHYVQELEELQCFPSGSLPYHIFFSADLKDAYTNCTLEHLKSCFLFLASVIDEPLWRQDLVVKLADLVLSNNFVEAGCRFYLTGSMLPIGSSCSGEALDIIALAGELVYIVNPPLSDASIALMPDYIKPYSAPSSDILKHHTYSRYRDDTMVIASGRDPVSILESIVHISGRIFPTSIPICLEISTFFSSFLDVCFFPNFSARRLSSFLRLNFDKPSTIRHSSSNTPQRLLIAPCLTNTIRALRTCSDQFVFATTKELFIEEYVKLGYNGGFLNILNSKLGQVIKKHSAVHLFGGTSEPENEEEVKFFQDPPCIGFCKCCNIHAYLSYIKKNVSSLLPCKLQPFPVSIRNDAQSLVSSKRIYKKIVLKYISNNFWLFGSGVGFILSIVEVVRFNPPLLVCFGLPSILPCSDNPIFEMPLALRE